MPFDNWKRNQQYKICHGCYGKGWVENSKGEPKICPVCTGKGKTIKVNPILNDRSYSHII